MTYSAWSLALLAVIGLAGGWLLAGWILRPLQDINAAARIAAGGRLDHRINLTGRSDEFKELADNFDDMLARLDVAFAMQERFVANASHELRTPLAVTATMLDVARADPEQDSELLRRLQVTNARSVGLLEALLGLADANAVSATFAPVDLAEITREALAEAEPGDVAIEAELAPATVIGDRALLTQVVANLVQNAIRHGYTNARVTTTPRRHPSGRERRRALLAAGRRPPRRAVPARERPDSRRGLRARAGARRADHDAALRDAVHPPARGRWPGGHGGYASSHS